VEVRYELTECDVKELAAFRSEKYFVLSLYLDLSVTDFPTKKDLEEEANSLLQSAVRQLENKHKTASGFKEAIDDARHLQRFLELDFSREGATAFAAFVCRPEGLERCYVFCRPVRARASIDRSPYVRPLNAVLTENSAFGVILCNRRKARLLAFHLGRQRGRELVVQDPVHGRHDQGGWSQARYARHIEREAHDHFKHVAKEAEEYFTENPVDRLILAGPVEDLVEARRCLPPYLEKRIVRELHIDVNTKVAELGRIVDEIDAAVEAEEDARLVHEMREGLGTGKAVAGLESVLKAVSDGQVRVLLVSRGLRVSGWRCGMCRALLMVGPRCERCRGNSATRVDDVVEEAIQDVLINGGHVELVTGDPDLDVMGGIGALLRFSS